MAGVVEGLAPDGAAPSPSGVPGAVEKRIKMILKIAGLAHDIAGHAHEILCFTKKVIFLECEHLHFSC